MPGLLRGLPGRHIDELRPQHRADAEVADLVLAYDRRRDVQGRCGCAAAHRRVDRDRAVRLRRDRLDRASSQVGTSRAVDADDAIAGCRPAVGRAAGGDRADRPAATIA